MIAAIELGILARLRATGAALGINWATLRTYPEDFDEYLSSDAQIGAIAAWVVFAGWQGTQENYGDDGPSLTVEGASFGLVVAYENSRPNEEPLRHGGPDPAKEPGSYRMLLAAVASLSGQTLGLALTSPLDVGPLRPIRPTEAIRKRKLSMYAVELTCDFDIAIVDDGATGDDLLRIHANWSLHPDGIDVLGGGDPLIIGADGLPDDAKADASDTVSLEEPEE